MTPIASREFNSAGAEGIYLSNGEIKAFYHSRCFCGNDGFFRISLKRQFSAELVLEGEGGSRRIDTRLLEGKICKELRLQGDIFCIVFDEQTVSMLLLQGVVVDDKVVEVRELHRAPYIGKQGFSFIQGYFTGYFYDICTSISDIFNLETRKKIPAERLLSWKGWRGLTQDYLSYYRDERHIEANVVSIEKTIFIRGTVDDKEYVFSRVTGYEIFDDFLLLYTKKDLAVHNLRTGNEILRIPIVKGNLYFASGYHLYVAEPSKKLLHTYELFDRREVGERMSLLADVIAGFQREAPAEEEPTVANLNLCNVMQGIRLRVQWLHREFSKRNH